MAKTHFIWSNINNWHKNLPSSLRKNSQAHQNNLQISTCQHWLYWKRKTDLIWIILGFRVFVQLWKVSLVFIRINRDKTMTDKLMYIFNINTQNYPFYRLKLVDKSWIGTQLNFHNLSVWLIISSNPADINRFQSQTGKIVNLPTLVLSRQSMQLVLKTPT